MASQAFELLAKPIQRILWDMRWRDLRAVQVEAIHHILEDSCDLIISARTASGKTEAAFLPILSRIYAKPQPSIQALYVGPLKALINDQFRRLEDLCGRAEIAVHRWHGDVGASQKKALVENPSGVLLITPESIESLFVNRSSFLSHVFQHLAFVVIDELHAFVGRERGLHLRSLLFRLARFAEKSPRMVALSATLGDWVQVYSQWMRPGKDGCVHHLAGKADQRRVLYAIQGYILPAGNGSNSRDQDDDDDSEVGVPEGMIGDMHKAFAGKHNLIFANRKDDVECFADALNQYCRQSGQRPQYLVHHGSLSAEIREHTERLMQSSLPHTTLCSSTLELGIDIGSVAAVGQIGAPWSVSSLIQRLGRSGRAEGEPQVMRVYLPVREPGPKSTLVQRLYPELLRAIAVTELMLQKWIEPPHLAQLDLSTLTQQILSVLAETGGISASRLSDRLITLGAFSKVSTQTFGRLLRSLASNDLIEQMSGGDLILAPAGERVVHNFDFYSAFATPVEYSVISAGESIGRIPATAAPNEHDHLLLGGRRWEVVEVCHDRCEVLVVPAHGRKPPIFSGGIGEIHPRIRWTMRDILLGQKVCGYLNHPATRLLDDARKTAAVTGLGVRSLIALCDEACLWFTWTGTTIQRTLCLMGDLLGLQPTDQDVAIHFPVGVKEVVARYREMSRRPPHAESLAQRIPGKLTRKFDQYIAEPLLVESLAEDALAVPDAVQVINAMLARDHDGC